jgi:hypothetical protein
LITNLRQLYNNITGDDMMTAGHFALFIIINISFIYTASKFLNADILE